MSYICNLLHKFPINILINLIDQTRGTNLLNWRNCLIYSQINEPDRFWRRTVHVTSRHSWPDFADLVADSRVATFFFLFLGTAHFNDGKRLYLQNSVFFFNRGTLQTDVMRLTLPMLISHGRVARKMGLGPESRINMLRNILTGLVRHERIETTLARADEVRFYAEKVKAIRCCHLASVELINWGTGEDKRLSKLKPG